ncbi:MAG: Helix-turn-helix domain protein [Lentisphaerae bacterium ADurb.Bin082]|jgi:transcriptional regulator with XRE-family HTH domain|nr:MAG: Helix-turn-helix domain protein [Lentisphaerae bacterium ADurb.Bin082]
MAGNPAFGNRIRELREAKRQTDPTFSLRQFAQRVGISATFLSKVERGEFDPPSAENIIKMAELLGTDADELLALAGRVDPELDEIIRQRPKAMAEFLRTAHQHQLTADEIAELTRRIRRDRQE